MAAKHLAETTTIDTAKHPRMGPTHSQQQQLQERGLSDNSGKASARATKHPPENNYHRRGKASADGADTLSAAKRLQERGPEQQATTAVTPPTSTTSQS
jgi:hypothetical protein